MFTLGDGLARIVERIVEYLNLAGGNPLLGVPVANDLVKYTGRSVSAVAQVHFEFPNHEERAAARLVKRVIAREAWRLLHISYSNRPSLVLVSVS
jgi:hypothetical protein